MPGKTNIEWATDTWNPVTGCSKVSEGCRHCYAKFQVWPRLAANPSTPYYGRKFEDVMCHPERLTQPMKWKRPRRIFVNSMSDLFHEAIPDVFIAQVFSVMEACPHHIFQVLTKRPERMLDWTRMVDDNFLGCLLVNEEDPSGKDWSWSEWPLPNVWLGVSIEDQATADSRVPFLLDTSAVVRWLSCEPLLGSIDLRSVHALPPEELPFLERGTPLCHDPHCRRGGPHYPREFGCRWSDIEQYDQPPGPINWVVVGGESGKHARPMDADWARSIRDQCIKTEIPFFFKQWGEWIDHKRVGKKKAGRVLDFQLWNQYPPVRLPNHVHD